MKMLLLSLIGTACIVLQASEVGSLRLHVALAGEPPLPPIVIVDKTPEFCGTTIKDTILTATSSGIASAVVAIKSPIPSTASAPSVSSLQLTAAHCLFAPRIQAAGVNSTLRIGSEDLPAHNPHGWLNHTATVFNITIPNQGISFTRRLRSPGLYRIDCDTHRWMHAYVLVFSHPFFAVTDRAGTATVSNVPPGTYSVSVWHELLGETNLDVSVKSNVTTEMNIKWSLNDRRPEELRPITAAAWP